MELAQTQILDLTLLSTSKRCHVPGKSSGGEKFGEGPVWWPNSDFPLVLYLDPTKDYFTYIIMIFFNIT